jgi:hypothetical protein
MPATFEQLRTTSAGDDLRTLVDYLSAEVTNPAIVNALLLVTFFLSPAPCSCIYLPPGDATISISFTAKTGEVMDRVEPQKLICLGNRALRWHYGAITDGRGLSDARANACEIVAWRFLTRLSERDVVEFCLYEIPDPRDKGDAFVDEECAVQSEDNERTSLLGRSPAPSESPHGPDHQMDVRRNPMRRSQLLESVSKLTMSRHATDIEDQEGDPTAPFIHLNALEIAAIADAKRFLSQHIVQKIITGIWNGDIIFWDRLSASSKKKPRFYNPHAADPFSRLRVPKYLKAYEVAFFSGFLLLYYGVLIEQNRYAITSLEIALYIWFAAFFYDEVSEYIDAGSIFYAADVWNLFDMIMIAIGIVYFILSELSMSPTPPMSGPPLTLIGRMCGTVQ